MWQLYNLITHTVVINLIKRKHTDNHFDVYYITGIIFFAFLQAESMVTSCKQYMKQYIHNPCLLPLIPFIYHNKDNVCSGFPGLIIFLERYLMNTLAGL